MEFFPLLLLNFPLVLFAGAMLILSILAISIHLEKRQKAKFEYEYKMELLKHKKEEKKTEA